MEHILPLTTYFASPRPAVARLPHVITALDADLIGEVAYLTKSRPGLWRIPAPFDDGDRFDDTRDEAPLAEWALPLNQAEVQGFRWLVAEAVFGAKLMFVDSAADEAILGEMAVLAGRRLDNGAWVTDAYEDLELLPALLQRIGWALIPIGPERSKGLFVTSANGAAVVERLEEWIERQGRNRAAAREQGGEWVIIERDAPPDYRDNALAHRIDGFLGELECYFGPLEFDLSSHLEQRRQQRRQLRTRIAEARQPSPPA